MFQHKIVLIVSLLLTAFTSSIADGERNQKWEVYLAPQYVASKTLSFDKGDVDLDDRTGWSFGFGYNFSDYFSGDVQFGSSSGNYLVSTVDENNDPVKGSSSMTSSNIMVGLTYNMIDGPFTPFLSGSVGMAFVDSGVSDGGVECYSYYYYYPTCYQSTHTTTEFSYAGSAGLRYDFKNMLFVKGEVGLNVVDFNSDNTPYFTVYELTVGTKF